ncbi:hypothetical protein [Microbulbifer salipaludis]|nr:hypothetical protein [Microbulbifer salipaludis]
MTDKIIQNIRENKYDRNELEKLLSNAERLNREDIIEAVKESLQEIDPRSYSKRYVKPIREKVKGIAEEIMNSQGWGAWPENLVGNGVKAGGPMMNGEVLAEFYISYKKEGWKNSSYLAVVQPDEESVVHYMVKKHGEEGQIVYTSSEAIEFFAAALET